MTAMHSFVRLPGGLLVKAIDRGDDWQMLVSDGSGAKIVERWFSTWASDRDGSLRHAFRRTCAGLGVELDGEVLRASTR